MKRLAACLLVAGAASLCILPYVGARGRARPEPRANVFVAPDGSDGGSRCRRFANPRPFPTDRSAVCASFDKAYGLARPGDTVLVGNGTYIGNQTICRDGSYPLCRPNVPDRPGPAIVVRAETLHGAVVRGELLLGGNDGRSVPPSNIVIDGIDVNGQVHARGTDTAPPARNVVFENMHVWTIANEPEPDLGGITWDDGNVVSLTFSHVEVGPLCCRSDGFYFPMSAPDVHVPVGLTIVDSTVHDLYDTCRAVRAAIVRHYGACSGQGYGDDGIGDHIDGIHLWGGATNLVLLRDRWYGISLPGVKTGQTIFLECGDAAGFGRPITCTNVEIANNMIYSGSGTVDNVVSIGNHYPGTSGIAGSVRILYNTFWSAAQGNDVLALADTPAGGFAPSATLEMVGNIAPNKRTCLAYRHNGMAFLPTYRMNEFGNRACNRSDHKGWPSFLSNDQYRPNTHLVANGQWAIRTRPARTLRRTQQPTSIVAVAHCPRTDIDGDPRPMTGCDVGADQVPMTSRLRPRTKP